MSANKPPKFKQGDLIRYTRVHEHDDLSFITYRTRSSLHPEEILLDENSDVVMMVLKFDPASDVWMSNSYVMLLPTGEIISENYQWIDGRFTLVVV